MKTEYSQQKYLKKKYRKHFFQFRVYSTCIANIAQTLYLYDPQKIKCLRPDALSILLQYANLVDKSKMLLIDQTRGLVLGSVMDRLNNLDTEIYVMTNFYSKS